jgi:hypothetical protein
MPSTKQHLGRIIAILVSAPFWAAALAGPCTAHAEILGDARVGFSADRVLVVDGHTYVGKIWHMPGRQRHEQPLPAIKPIFILRADRALAEIVLPQLHTIAELAFPKELSLLHTPDLLGEPVGHEPVDGIATTKYALSVTSPEGRGSGFVWLSDEHIPMKLDGRVETRNGKVTTIHWELSHVRIGRQADALFDVPAGFTRLPPEAVAPLLGMKIAPPHTH